MADNLIFSINTALPIFLVLLIGWALKTNKIIDDSFTQTANTLVFYIALPIKLFYDVSRTAFSETFDTALILFLIVITLGSVVISWVIGRICIKDPAQFGAFVHGCFRGNFLYIGFSLMENITGGIGPKAPIAAAFVIPMYNILAVVILTYAGPSTNPQKRVSNTLKSIFRNPLILAIGAGVAASLLSLEMPLFATRTMSYFSALTTPLALIAIGASFTFRESLHSVKPALLASGVKLILLPFFAVSLAWLAGFRGHDVVLVYILVGVPTATTSYIMTAAMKGDKDLASSIIMISTAFSVVTMTAFVFAFKSFGII